MSASVQVVSLSSIPAGVRTWRSKRRGLANLVACKATYRLVGPEVKLAADQELLIPADTHWDNDPRRSLRMATDWAPYKRRTDVILVGSAYAPAGTQVRRLVACMSVAGIEKALEVRCDRTVARDDAVQEGAAFERMPLRWERAGGGSGTANPVGVAPDRDGFGKLSLPNLQPIAFDPAGPDWYVPPVGFGPIPPTWPGRMNALGTYASAWSEHWIETGLPDDLDFSYFQAAPRDQQLERFSTDATITLENLHPSMDRFSTRLPGHRARALVDPEGLEIEMVCDTLVIDTERLLATLTWRGSFWESDCPNVSRVILALESRDSPLSTEAMLELANPEDTVNLPGNGAVTAALRAAHPHAASLVGLPFSPPSNAKDSDKPLPSFETAELMAEHMMEDPSTESRFEEPPEPMPLPPPSKPPPVPPPLVGKSIGLVPPPPSSAVRKLSSPPDPVTVAHGRATVPRPSVPAPSKKLIDLLWYAHGALARIRASSAVWSAIDDGNDSPQSQEPDRIIGRTLTRVAGVDRAGLERAFAASIDDDGFLVRPLLVMDGEIELIPDPLQVLRATATLANAKKSNGSADKEKALDRANELLADDRPTTIEAVEQALEALRRAYPDATMRQTVDRSMLEEKRWWLRSIVGGVHIGGRLHTGKGAPIVTYIPEDASTRLPLLSRFPVRVLVEPHLRQEERTLEGLAIVVVALARTADRPK